MKIFPAFSLLSSAHGSKVTRILLREEGEGLGSRLGEPGNEANAIHCQRYLFADSAKTTVSRDAVAPPLSRFSATR